VFRDGYHYVLNLKSGVDELVQFQRTVFPLESGRTPSSAYRRKAASTAHLARSSASEDVAEFQWRLSTGFSTVLMSLLAIPLSRFAPRSSKYGKVTAAIVLFFVFYNLSLIAKTWVENRWLERCRNLVGRRPERTAGTGAAPFPRPFRCRSGRRPLPDGRTGP